MICGYEQGFRKMDPIEVLFVYAVNLACWALLLGALWLVCHALKYIVLWLFGL
jgi:hypothetical protein